MANIRELSRLKPSTMMLRLLDGITFSDNATVLDAPCGFGRNAIALAAQGLAVVSADKDCGRLDSLKRAVAALKSSKQTHPRILPVCVDLNNNRWPFLESSFSAVVCIHFPVQEIIENLKSSLREGGYIYIETFGGQGERKIPTSITMCAISGGPKRWLNIELDLSEPSGTFVQQALAALPSKLHLGKDGRLTVPFFGYALGFIVNYSPDQAVRYDMKGTAVENLSKAFRPGEAWFSLKGGKQIADVGRSLEVVEISTI